MTFTTAGRFIAKLVIVLAVVRIAIAMIVTMSQEPGSAAVRYLGPGSTGQVIDEAIYAIIFAICLGVLTDISRAVQRT